MSNCPHGRPNGLMCKFGCFQRMAIEREKARTPDEVAPAIITEEDRAKHDARKWTERHRRNRYGR